LRVIPVMDILGGKVVHARKGERDKYRPIETVLSKSAEPVEVAKAFYREFSFEELYVADLDAILGKEASIEYIRRICKATPMEVMVDAGVSSFLDARKLGDAGASRIIVGTETLSDVSKLSLIVDRMGGDKIISSLDLRDGKVISRSATLKMQAPTKAAKILEGIGVSQLIVLELTRVGSESGADRSLAGSIVKSVKIPVITGGGVRNMNDLAELKKTGVDGVLVATSLHTGSITKRDLASLG